MKKQDILENPANYAYLAIGSNLGKKIYNIEHSKYMLCKKGINVKKSSSYYITRSWPNPKFPKFVNLVLLVKTKLSLLKLFKEIKLIEKSLGRVDAPRNYPRKCDIDILDFNGKSFNFIDIDIIVPHPRMEQRSFVLLPLFEINKSWIHPKSKKNILNLLSNMNGDDIRSVKFK